MTVVPATSIPQAAWLNLVAGQIQASAAISVPTRTYLQANGSQDGLSGSTEGELIYLAGYLSELDGGQGWYMWVGASTAPDNATTVLNPWATVGRAGRWVRSESSGGGASSGNAGQIVTAGA